MTDQSHALQAAPAQIVSFVSQVVYTLAAQPLAREALLGALQSSGLASTATIAAVMDAEETRLKHPAKPLAQDGEGVQSGKAGKPGKKPGKASGKAQNGDAEEEEKKRKRGPSAMNVFLAYLYEIVGKDLENPAYQPPEPTGANGKPVRIQNVKLVSTCWNAMSETDKARFQEMVQPFLAARGEGAALHDGHQGKMIDEFHAFLKDHGYEEEMRAIYNRSVEAGTGISPVSENKAVPRPAPSGVSGGAGGGGAGAIPASPGPSVAKTAAATGHVAPPSTSNKRKAEKHSKDVVEAPSSKKLKTSHDAVAKAPSQQQPVSKAAEDELSAKKKSKDDKKNQKAAAMEAARKAEEEKKRQEREQQMKKSLPATQDDDDEDDDEDEEDEDEEDEDEEEEN